MQVYDKEDFGPGVEPAKMVVRQFCACLMVEGLYSLWSSTPRPNGDLTDRGGGMPRENIELLRTSVAPLTYASNIAGQKEGRGGAGGI